MNFCSAIQDETFAVIDDHRKIVSSYLRGWFIIDVVAIFPLELIISSNANSLIRVARIGKLYKLIKITRLVRLVKIIKSQGKVLNKLN